MRFVDSISAAAEIQPSPEADRDVGAALACGLQLPLAALRASIETLASEVEPRERKVMLNAVLEEVDGKTRDILAD